MADDLLDRIRSAYAAWNEGDLEHTLDFLADDVEWHTSASFPGTRPLYEGHEGFKLFWEHLHAPFDSIHVELESYQRDGDIALIRLRFHGTSKASGIDMDLPWFQVIRIGDDEQIVSSALDRSVGDALEALDAAGLWAEF